MSSNRLQARAQLRLHPRPRPRRQVHDVKSAWATFATGTRRTAHHNTCGPSSRGRGRHAATTTDDYQRCTATNGGYTTSCGKPGGASAAYASTTRSNLRAHAKKPVPFRTSFHDWEAPTPGDSYSESGESARDEPDSEWDYHGLRDRDAFRSFHAAADYYLTCSDYSTEGSYDPCDECFIVEIADENKGGAIGLPGGDPVAALAHTLPQGGIPNPTLWLRPNSSVNWKLGSRRSIAEFVICELPSRAAMKDVERTLMK